jgi:HIT family protein
MKTPRFHFDISVDVPTKFNEQQLLLTFHFTAFFDTIEVRTQGGNTMTDCIFDKIINKEIPAHIVYEDDVVLAFLDISQVTPGHTLVVPKKHVANIFEYDEDLASTVFARIPKIARAVEASNPNIKGLNILSNNGELAYQSVFHSHIHLIPRYTKEDGFGLKWEPTNPSSEVLAKIAQSIREKLEA